LRIDARENPVIWQRLDPTPLQVSTKRIDLIQQHQNRPAQRPTLGLGRLGQPMATNITSTMTTRLQTSARR
jgi:hypothetical protein